ncbi:MAG: hypothetical protein IPN29_14635 [Saprospiraceae bacterium]|nr:hypothetical protein [Saprospiraceae bacterium]
MEDSSKAQWDKMRIKLMVLCFVLPLIAWAQKPTKVITQPTKPPTTSRPQPATYPGSTGATDTFAQAIDSVPLPPFEYKYFYMDQPGKNLILADTALGYFFQDADPARRKTFNALSTGNAGSAAIDPLFKMGIKTGFNLGYDGYEPLNFSPDSIKFYNSLRPLADLSFSPIFGSQQNFIVGAEYGQKFSDGFAVSLNYRRISQLGFYQNQSTQTTSLAIALRYQSEKQTFNMFTGFVGNANNEQHNGGVDTTLLYRTNYQFRINVPIGLTDTKTRQDFKTIIVHSTLSLDGINTDSSKLAVGHQLQYRYGYTGFSDAGLTETNDTLFYGSFLTDDRGIRNRINLSQVSNTFLLRTFWSQAEGTLSLVHDYFRLNDGGNARTINDLTLKFNGGFSVKKAVFIQTNVALGLGANAGNFLVKGNTTLRLGKIASLSAILAVFRSQQAWNQENLYLNTESVYLRDFKTPFGSNYAARVSIPFLGLSIEAGQHILENFIYRDVNALPNQEAGSLVATHLAVSQHSRWKVIHLETHGFLQKINRAYLPLPEAYLKTNLYLELPLFKKKMLLRTGGELKYMPAFNLPEYDPVTGSYYLGDQSYKRNYMSADFYILAKVSKFRIFFKFENIQEYLNNKINYLAAFHPQFDNTMRVGFRWLLLD